VIVAQADACDLPVIPASCDAAVMVGVLEWVAWGRDGPPQALQRQALGEVYQALKPGGCLYLALENRFSIKYFLGYKEPHIGLRFISLLPNFIAQIYSRMVLGREYRELTYSIGELRKLLETVGFEEIHFSFPVLNYQIFRFIISLRDKKEIRFVLEHGRGFPRFTRWLYMAGRIIIAILPLRIIRFFWPSFAVLAVKS
jgi:SAM-dependent methyltransferase